MSQIIDHVGDRYLCPVTQKTETVLIQQTTMRPETLAFKEEAAVPVSKDLKYCSGLDTCGVMQNQDDHLTFTWDHCPLKTAL